MSQDMKLHTHTSHPKGHNVEKCMLKFYIFCKVFRKILMDNLKKRGLMHHNRETEYARLWKHEEKRGIVMCSDLNIAQIE